MATATGLSATNARRKFGFERCSTDHRGLLADEAVDAVLIATRHHAHAAMVCEALRAGKAVFVEKPLAVSRTSSRRSWRRSPTAAMTASWSGSTARFAPLLADLKAAFGARSGRCRSATTSMQDGWRLAAGTPNPSKARLVAEGCHFVDTISWWLDQDPVAVFTAATGDPDDTAITLLYPDGSVATIAYQTSGDPRAPKEQFQATGDGQVARLHNFQRTELWRGGRRQVRRSRSGIDKGQKQELDAFVRAVAERGPCRSRWRRWWPRPGRLLGPPQPGQPPPGELADVEPAGRSPALPTEARRNDLGWYARRLASMSPAEMAGRAHDELTKRRWRARQVTDAGADAADVPAACPPFAALLPDAADDVPEDARVRLKEAAEGLLGGRWPVFAHERNDMAPAPDWFLARAPSEGRRTGPTASTSTTATAPPSGTQVRVGAVPPHSTSPCWRPPTTSPATSGTRRPSPPSCTPGGR